MTTVDLETNLTYLESLIARNHNEEAIRFIQTLRKEYRTKIESDLCAGMKLLQ